MGKVVAGGDGRQVEQDGGHQGGRDNANFELRAVCGLLSPKIVSRRPANELALACLPVFRSWANLLQAAT